MAQVAQPLVPILKVSGTSGITSAKNIILFITYLDRASCATNRQNLFSDTSGCSTPKYYAQLALNFANSIYFQSLSSPCPLQLLTYQNKWNIGIQGDFKVLCSVHLV